MKSLIEIKEKLNKLYKFREELHDAPNCTYRDVDSEIKALSFVIKNYDEDKVKAYLKKSNENLKKMFMSMMRRQSGGSYNEYLKETEIKLRINMLTWVLD